MPRSIRPHGPAAALLLAALLPGCSEDAPAPLPPAPTTTPRPQVGPGDALASTPPDAGEVRTETIPSDSTPALGPIELTSEVPNDAVGYFECASLEELEILALRFQNLIGAGVANVATGAALATLPLVGVGIDPTKIDRHRPIAVAFAPVPGELFPAPLVIAPARDEGPIVSSAATLAARGMKARRIHGGYVVVEHTSAPARESLRGEATVTKDLPTGVIRGRFATETFTPLFSPQLFDWARQMNESYRLSRPRQSAQDLYEFDAELVLRAMREAHQIAFGIELDGDKAIVALQTIDSEPFTADPPLPESKAALAELCHHVDPDDPLSLLVAYDPETAATELFSALDDVRAVLAAYGVLDGTEGPHLPVDEIGEALGLMLQSFDAGAHVALQLEPGKAHVGVYLSADQATRAREAISLLLSKCDLDDWGFEMALPIRSMLDRTLVEDYTVRFDTRRLDFDQRARMRETFKTFLGDSTLHLKVATSGDHVLVLLGGDTTAVNGRIRRFSSTGLADIDLVRGIEMVEGTSDVRIVRTDFVKLLGQFAGLREVSKGHSLADTYREISREVGESEAPFVFWTGIARDDRVLGASFELDALAAAFEAFKGAGL